MRGCSACERVPTRCTVATAATTACSPAFAYFLADATAAAAAAAIAAGLPPLLSPVDLRFPFLLSLLSHTQEEQAAEDLAMSFEQLADGKAPKSKAAFKIPELKGKRAAAHEEAELDIDIDDVVPSIRPPTRLPAPLKSEKVPLPPAEPGRLSVTDYKRRMGIL